MEGKIPSYQWEYSWVVSHDGTTSLEAFLARFDSDTWTEYWLCDLAMLSLTGPFLYPASEWPCRSVWSSRATIRPELEAPFIMVSLLFFLYSLYDDDMHLNSFIVFLNCHFVVH